MKKYPLGSFPRFGYQERRAQERRQRVIAKSIATRRWKKWARENPDALKYNFDAATEAIELNKRERELFSKIHRLWVDLASQIRRKTPPNESLRDEAIWIAQKVRDFSGDWGWSSRGEELLKLHSQIIQFVEKWNSEKNRQLDDKHKPSNLRKISVFYFWRWIRYRLALANFTFKLFL